jgi:perosamine synthetase
VTSRTRAIVVVHYAGRSVDVRRLRESLGARIHIIEDCAHAAGSRYYGKAVGSEGNLACFSFHAVKNLAMGDGGALIPRHRADYDRARRLRWLGIDRDTWTRTDENRQYWWRYNVCEIGHKCHLNDISAAIGLVQLGKLQDMNARRRAIVNLYNELLHDVVRTPPPDSDDMRSSWHIYHIRTPRRDDLAAHLASKGICTGVHYYPIHLYPCYGSQQPPSLPNAEQAFKEILTLPLYPDLTDEQVRMIAAEIRTFLGRPLPAALSESPAIA